jgi:hypothetical protein
VTEYKRGEIFYDKYFIYEDSHEYCDKLLLVLNKNYVIGDDVAIVPATTNKRNYPYKNGCNKNERVYYIEKCIGYYRDKTIIQYDSAERITAKEFERRVKSREMERKNQNISDTELQSILSCLRSIKEDVDVEIYELVF